MNELELYGAHRAPVDATDPRDGDPQRNVRVLPIRGLPRHRARRRQWKPPQADPSLQDSGLQPVHAQHAYDRDTFVR